MTTFVGLFPGLNDPRHFPKPFVSLQIINEHGELVFLSYCPSMSRHGNIFKSFATCLQDFTIL